MGKLQPTFAWTVGESGVLGASPACRRPIVSRVTRADKVLTVPTRLRAPQVPATLDDFAKNRVLQTPVK